jgi:lipase maturation factor
LWFTIYFESGIAKYFGGDPSWRDLSAMNAYYQNGPLPTWIGWYAHQLPVWFHESTAFVTLGAELLVVWLVLLPRGTRTLCFFFMTSLQIAIILTANYAFLNHIVLALGIFLLDDQFLIRMVPNRWRHAVEENLHRPPAVSWRKNLLGSFAATHESLSMTGSTVAGDATPAAGANVTTESDHPSLRGTLLSASGLWLKTLALAWVFYAMAFLMFQQASPGLPLPAKPVTILEPFRIANSYGLFGRMTWARYEIEFQGSNDGTNWVAYPFRYKPQNLREAPGIYAPYQPRFEWNLWFASLGTWRENPFVLRTEQQLLSNNRDVVALFGSNPFASAPPKQIRAVLWQYWFTDRATKRATGQWWRREFRGLYAPTLMMAPDGKIMVAEWPQTFIPPP